MTGLAALLRPHALAVAAMLALVPACGGAFADRFPEAGGVDDGADGACPFSSVFDDGQGSPTCADCFLEDEAITICGEERVALCESKQGTRADCSICHLGGGEFLYEDCFAPFAVGATCFEAVDAQFPGQQCEVCFDEAGTLTKKECAPPHTRTEEIGACTLYYDGDVEVLRACPRPAIAPSFCEVYEDEDGRCVDCFEGTSEPRLVSHECSGIDPKSRAGALRCADKVAADGRVCQVCSDARGVFVSEVCDEVAPTTTRCQTIALAGQDLTACTDDVGRLRRLAWGPSACAGADCIDRDSCVLAVGDGTVCASCRTFADEERAGCMEGPGFSCYEVLVDSAEDGAAGRSCTYCQDDNGIPLSDSCSAYGGEAPAPTEPPPPTSCTPIGDGTCQSCTDWSSGQSFTICDQGSCSASNEAYTISDTTKAQCQTCGDASAADPTTGAGVDYYDRCWREEPCAADGQAAEYDGACPTLERWVATIGACGSNGWDQQADATLETRGGVVASVMRWSDAQVGVRVYVGTVMPDGVEDADCFYEGDTLTVEVPPGEGDPLAQHGFSLLQ